jgi:hypothetical protein
MFLAYPCNLVIKMHSPVQSEYRDFTFMHCFKKLEGCMKWDDVRLTLNDGKGTDDREASSPLVVGCAWGGAGRATSL